MNSINKCTKEIKEKMQQRSTDLKFTDDEIESLKKKIENNKKDTENISKTLGTKKTNVSMSYVFLFFIFTSTKN